MKSLLPALMFAAASTGLIAQTVSLTERPAAEKRNFHSDAVEKLIAEVKAGTPSKEYGDMFEKTFPNTLDTTVHFSEKDGVPDTYVITGDIDAMWLRDSSAQVNQYIPLAKDDPKLAKMINGLIRRQARCILLDPYANAFYPDPHRESEWKSDHTEMKAGVHERKWELDSLSYPIRLSYEYWKATGDTSAFDQTWLDAMQLAVDTMKDQQRKDGNRGKYSFMRTTAIQTDTVPGAGWGNPWKETGMICSTFRNSDDAAIYLFNIPENLFAVTALNQLAEILDAIKQKPELAKEARALSKEVEAAVKKHGIVDHPKYGQIYAYEVDGFGNVLLMDDAGLPSLVSIPYLGYGTTEDPVYVNTRKFALSADNPYFYQGKAAEGTGSPHLAVKGEFIWPMGISTRGLTSSDEKEMRKCLEMLRKNTAGTGFMHEGFDKDNGDNFSRPWFAWSNSLFSEFLLKAYRQNPKLLE